MKPETSTTVLIGEDESEVREYLEIALKYLNYRVELAEDGDEVINRIASSSTKVSAVLLDIMMPKRDGIETLREIRRIDPNLPVIIVSGFASTLNVVTAMKSGATDFLCKPVNHHDLQKALNKALADQTDRCVVPASLPVPKTNFFLGASRKMADLQSRIKDVGWSDAPVLIRGETGSGKEMLARELHANSPRAEKIFLKLNCAALPSELVESELFGYERGAFTGAFQKRIGMFEMANEGTLLLDEIGDMDVRLQAKLLQVLQDHEFQRIGGKEVIKVDVRIMSATHRDLDKAIVEGTFREDLYYRLNVINVQLPPLRERTEDILPLAEFLLKKHAVPGAPLLTITPELRHALVTYHWPGNVRELENAIRQLLALRDPKLLTETLSTNSMRRPAPGREEVSRIPETPKAPDNAQEKALVWAQVKKAKRQTEADAILAALDAARWNRKQAAAILQIDYKALLYKMKTLGVKDKHRNTYPVTPPKEVREECAASVVAAGVM